MVVSSRQNDTASSLALVQKNNAPSPVIVLPHLLPPSRVVTTGGETQTMVAGKFWLLSGPRLVAVALTCPLLLLPSFAGILAGGSPWLCYFQVWWPVSDDYYCLSSLGYCFTNHFFTTPPPSFAGILAVAPPWCCYFPLL